MTMTRDAILTAARSICKATASTSALADAKVILWADKQPDGGLRPPVPYIAVNLISTPQIGFDEVVPVPGLTALALTSRGLRSGTVAIHGIGAGSDDWLESIRSRLPLDTARAIMEAAGCEFLNPGPVQNVSALLDTAVQPHYVLDLEISYLDERAETVPWATAATVNVVGNDVSPLPTLTTTASASLLP